MGPLSFLGVSVASQLPNPAQPEFPAVVGALGAFLGSARALIRTRSWDQAREAAFQAGFWGTAVGLIAYGFGLVTGVY